MPFQSEKQRKYLWANEPEIAREWTDKYGGIIIKQLKRLGSSCDWDRQAFTMSDEYYKSVIHTFVKLYEDGMIYKGERMINWDPMGLTALSNEEVIHNVSDFQLK